MAENLLEQLLFNIGKGVGSVRQSQIKSGKKYQQKGELARRQIAPLTEQLLQGLISLGGQLKGGFQSTLPQEQGQVTQTKQEPKFEDQLNPLQDNILKTVKKVQKDQIEEAMASGVPAESILQTGGIPSQPKMLSLSPQGLDSEPQQTQQPQILQPTNALTKAGITPEGNIQTAGWLNRTGPSIKEMALLQGLVGQEPLQKGKLQELSIQHRNKMTQIALSAALEGGKVDENQITAEVFKQDILGLVDAWKGLSLKGRGVGVAGAVGGALGFERDKRREFQASASSLLYSVASFIAGQEGRALSDRDIKLVETWAKFNTRDTKSDFIGKLNNLVKKANTRLTARGGIPLPDVETILSGGTQTQPTEDIQSQIAEIDKRLSELGGQ